MTELTWDGKYKDGKRVAPVRIPLPFQTVETVNESGQARAHNLDLWTSGRPTEWRNRLIWGDKKYVLPSLLPELAGEVNLIYIDPPFATGADFSFSAAIPDSDEEFVKEPSMIEQKAYRDTWGRGLDSYFQWFYETAALLHELLSEHGCIYVHSDWHANAGLRFILDEVFGSDHFINEIIWRRKQAVAWSAKQFGVTNDTILFYAKGSEFTFNAEYSREDENTRKYIAERFVYGDGDGRKYMKSPLVNPLPRPNLRYVFHGVNPPKTGWLYSQERLEALYAANELVMPADSNGRIYRKIFSDTYPGQVVQNIWTDIPIVNPMAVERVNFPTQKPEALLDRIIRASSNEGDLVLDCFCGSGTTAAVAEKLGRRWIAADLGRFAIHTTRKRLLSIPNVRPFDVQNLGKYERQAWQVAEFAEGDATQAPAAQLAYRRFMLDLYRAQPLDGYTWLHGVRDGRLVHVGGVDAPVAVGDVQQIVKEFWRVRTSPPNPLSQEERGSQSALAAGSQEERGRQRALAAGSQEERGRQSALAAGSQEERGRQRGSAATVASSASARAPSSPEPPPSEPTADSVLPLSPWERGPGGEVRSTGIDILGWDFAFELNEVAAQMAADAGVHLKFKRVPREVLEKKAVEQGDIKFFELAALDLRVSQKSSAAVDGVPRALGPHVTISLADFMVPTDDVPEEVAAAVKRWEQWIDYWAVDWDYKGDAFHNMAQTYRTRKDPRLQTSLVHTYDQPGEYTVVVKVIDILGNDTTKTLKVEVL